MLIFFKLVSDKVLGDDEAISVAKEILKRQPDNQVALEHMSKYNQR